MPKSGKDSCQAMKVATKADEGTQMPQEARRRPQHSTQKMKFCMYHLQGVCKYTGDTCAFAHSTEEMHRVRGNRRKRPTQTGREAAERPAFDGLPLHSGAPRSCDAWSKPPLAAGAGASAICSTKPATMASSQATKEAVNTWSKLKEPMFVEPLPRVAEPCHDAGAPTAGLGFQQDAALPYHLEAMGPSPNAYNNYIGYGPIPSPLNGSFGPLYGQGGPVVAPALDAVFKEEDLSELSRSIQNLSNAIGRLTKQATTPSMDEAPYADVSIAKAGACMSPATAPMKMCGLGQYMGSFDMEQAAFCSPPGLAMQTRAIGG